MEGEAKVEDKAMEKVWKRWASALRKPRALVHVSTDKPVYRPGEKVYIRGVLVPVRDFKETSKKLLCNPSWRLEVTSPKGEVLESSEPSSIENGVVAFQWLLPGDVPGGEYTLKVGPETWNSYSPSGVRKVQVRAFRNPSVRVKIDFLGSGYGPGDQVRARIGATRAVGGPVPAGTEVRVTATLDGGPWLPGPITAQLDGNGECVVDFDLPSDMVEGLGSLTAVVQDGGVVESGTKTIPIVLQALSIQLYPEGGPLVAGVPNNVYFEVLDPTGEPVALEAELWEVGPRGTKMLSNVTASHEGRGKFAVTPQHRYKLRVTKPAGISKSIALPVPEKELAVKGRGPLVALSWVQEGGGLEAVSQVGAGPIRVQLVGAQAGEVAVGLFLKEMQLDLVPVDLPQAGEPVVVALDPGAASGTAGVLRVTVFTMDQLPIAERLVFHRPAETLQVEVKPEKDGINLGAYPGAPQSLQIQVRDSQSRPVAGAVIGVAVTDKSTLGLVEDRKQPPRLPEMALLEAEVEHLEDPRAYLGPGPEASVALDLLLGTQGWRRFAYADPLQKLQAMDPEATVSHAVGEEDNEKANEEKRQQVERAMGLALAGRDYGMEGGPGGIAVPAMFMAKRAMAMPEMRAGLEVMGGPRMAVAEAAVMDMAAYDAAALPMAAEAEDMEGGSAGEWRGRPMETSVPFERVYAHKRREAVDGEGGARRSDFTETVYWAASLVTDHNGVAKVQFALSDAITLFAVQADAHTTPDSHVASSHWITRKQPIESQAFGASEEFLIQSQKPLSVDAKVPLELTTGDLVDLPISVVSAVPQDLEVSIGFGLAGGLEAVLQAGQGKTVSGQTRPGLRLVDAVELKGPGLLGPLERARYVLPIRALSYAEMKLQLNLSDTVDTEEGPSTSRSAEQQERMVEEVPGTEPQRTVRRLEGVVELEVQGMPRGLEASRKELVANLPAEKDAVQRTISIVPAGFPAQLAFGGVVKPGKEAVGGKVLLPETTVNGTISLEVALYRSPVAQLTQALEALIQEPCGCFEQTSATVYPLIMAQQFFRTHGAEASVMERSRKMLETGLERLRSFEVEGSGGYEWFGQSPAHEALTAYGLMEFVDLATVLEVPQAMIARTRQWLMQRKDDPQRSFQLNPAYLDGFGGAPPDVTLAYMVWALTAAGMREGLEPQVENLVEQAKRGSDPYFTALVAASLFTLNRVPDALPLARTLQTAQQLDGSIPGARTSITSSWGESLVVETTALAVLAWLQAPPPTEAPEGGSSQARGEEFADSTLRAMEWLASRCQGGAFGSTQATVLALKAIMAYEAQRAASKPQAGTAHLLVDGTRVASQPFEAAASLPLLLPQRGSLLRPGQEHLIQLEMEGGQPMPYSALVRYSDTRPATSEACSVRLATQLVQESLQEGDLAEVEVRLTNQKDRPLAMVVAVVGLPGGLEVRHEQLQELVKRGMIPFYEVRGREVVLYWRTLPATADVALRLEASAAVPGTFTGPASRAYEYYASEHKHWAEPLRATIAAKAAKGGAQKQNTRPAYE